MAIQTRPLGRTGANVTTLGYRAMELRGQPRGPAINDDEAGRLLGDIEQSLREGRRPRASVGPLGRMAQPRDFPERVAPGLVASGTGR